MGESQAGLSSSTMRKWLFFLIFLASLVLVYFVFLRPGGESEARRVMVEARQKLTDANAAAQKTREAADKANVFLAKEALDRAQKLLIESDYSGARTEAENALKLANNVLSKDTPVASFRAGTRVDEAVGDVTMRRGQTQNLEIAKKGVPVEAGDTINTAAGAACQLFFSSGIDVVLDPDTQIELQAEFSGDTKTSNLYLQKGTLSISLVDVPDNVRLNVITDHGKVVINPNCKTQVRYSPGSGSLTTRVLQGRVDVMHGGKETAVRNNQEVVILSNQLPQFAEDIPPPPELSSPDNFAEFFSNQNGFALVNLSWVREEKAQNYRVQVSSNDLFTAVVRDRPFFPGTTMSFPDLTNGTYFWRVISVDAKDREGMPSSTRRFQIVEPKTKAGSSVDSEPPDLKISKTQVQGYMYIIQGNSEKDATVWVNNEKAILDDYTGNFIFTASFPVAGVHEVSIVAMDRAGNRTFKKIFVEIVE